MTAKVLFNRHRSDIVNDLRHRAAQLGKSSVDDTHRKPQACELTQTESSAVVHLEAAWPLRKILWEEYDT